MPRSESDQEQWARQLVAVHLGVELVFVDTGAPVDSLHDYEFTDGLGRSAAMEVTSLTDEKLKRALDGYRKSRTAYGPTKVLSSCWAVTVTQRAARYRDLTSRLEPPPCRLGAGRGPLRRVADAGAAVGPSPRPGS